MRFIRNISARTVQRDETPPTGAAQRGTASHCGDSISRRRISGLQQDVVRRDQWLGKARQLRSWSAHAWKKADRSLGRTPWRMESSNSCRPRATTMSGNERARVPARHIWNSGLRKEWKMEIQDVRLQMKCSPFPSLLSGPLSELFTTVPVLVGGSALAAAGIIVSSFSPDITWLSVTLGVMHGLGLGIVITMLQVLISMYFERYRGTANGIMFAGSTASAFIFPHLLLYFKDTYGFRGSLLMFGAVLMNMVALSLAFREPHWFRRDRVKRGKSLQRTPRPSIFPTDPMKETKVSATAEVLRNICGVLKCPMMYVLVVTWLAFCYNYDIFFSTIVDFAMDKGLTLEDTVSFITYTSITDLVGRVVLPILTDRGFLQRSTLMTLNYFLLGLCGVLLPFCESYWALLVACLGLALFLGCAITMQSVLMAQYLGIEKLAVGYSVLGALCGPALLGKAPFVGFFRDDLGSYNEMFWVLGGLSFFVTFQWALVSLTDRQRVRKWQPDIAHPCSGQKT
ncbi:monocarboxylate transporter 12-like isoform X3 [Dermacentor silvarum]|uniref:monocarboxylate transporter 12-like isoform X3 n=1 Tax=Dermacentor silvarum TaxID=543639 RepID=UPI002101A6AB|nr:monocarboxylate transporter 12-like isoform X3 [Dermacentor silvarum]